MLLSKNAIGNLINRYKAVLKKCHLLNTFGSLAIVAALGMGALGVTTLPQDAHAATFTPTLDGLDAQGIRDIHTAISPPPSGYNDTTWATYIANLTTDPDSAYTVTPNVTAGDAANYFTTFTIKEGGSDVTYGIKIKGRDYDGSSNTETFKSTKEVLKDYITGQKSTAETGTPTYYDSIDFVSEVAEGGAAPAATEYTFSIKTKNESGADVTLYFAVMKGSSVLASNAQGIKPDSGYTGNFILNHKTDSGNIRGGAVFILNNENSITINGDFIGNSATSSDDDAQGGALFYSSYLSIITAINGDFIGNSATAGDANGRALGGAVYNSSTITTINGDFIGNSATAGSGGTANGGAVYNSGTITSLIGDFIGNSAIGVSDFYGRPALGGAVYNQGGTITSLIGDFIGNSVTGGDNDGTQDGKGGDAYGGAVYNNGTITSLIGDFIDNSATGGMNKANSIDSGGGGSGGAVYNQGGTITSLIGDFIGNSARGGDATDDATGASAEGGNAYGGAVFNSGSISTLMGDFIGNSVTGGTSTDSDGGVAGGGAVFNSGTITFKNSNFIGNRAIGGEGGDGASAGEAQGGAIWTNKSLTFVADGQALEISGNYTQNGNGGAKVYNAIYIADNDQSLTFNLQNGGSYTLDDNVNTDGTDKYTVNITGTGTGTNVFNLNNVLNNVSGVTVDNATLTLGTGAYDTGSISNAPLTIGGTSTINGLTTTGLTTISDGGNATFKGTTALSTVTNNASINALGNVTFNEGYASAGTLNIGSAATAGTVTLADDKNINIQSGGSLNVVNGTLDMSDHTLTVNASAASFSTGADGELTAKATDFGTITQAGGFTIDAATVAKQLTNEGTLILTNVGFDSMSKAADLKLQADDEWQSLVTGDGDVILQNASGAEVSITDLYSLTYVDESKQLATDNIMAGDLTGTNRTVTAASIVANTDESNLKNSTISGENVNLILAGKDASGSTTNATLAIGDMGVSDGAHLTLGVTDSPASLSFDGNITVDGDASKLTVGGKTTGGSVHMKGSDDTYHSVTLTNGADLDVLIKQSIHMSSLSMTDSSTVNIAGELILVNAASFDVSDFATQAGSSGIYLTGNLQAGAALTLTGGGALALADGAQIIARNGLTLVAETTLNGGKIDLAGTLSGDKLTVNTGELYIDAGKTLTADEDITFGSGGTLKVETGASLDIEGCKLTANLSDFGTVILDGHDFTSLDENGANVKTNLVGDGSTALVLNANNSEIVWLDNYDAMLAALKVNIFGDASAFDTTNLTITGYAQYQTLATIDADTSSPDAPIAAGDYAHNVSSTFAGIEVDRDGNADSSISGGGTLNLTGNSGNDRLLSTGNITVTHGILNLGYNGAAATQGGTIQGDLIVDKTGANAATAFAHGATVSVTGKTEIKNGGAFIVNSGSEFTPTGGITVDGTGSVFNANENVTTASLGLTNSGVVTIVAGKTVNVTSSMALAGGSMSVGAGTLAAAGFTNNSAVLNLTGGTLKSTAGISNTKAVTLDGGNIELTSGTWDAGADVTVSSGTLSLKSGTSMDTTGATLTVSGGTVKIDANTSFTLELADVGTITGQTPGYDSTGASIDTDTFTGINASSILKIEGIDASYSSMSEYEYFDLVTDIQEYLFSDDNGAIELLNVTVQAQSLNGVLSEWNKPTETLMAGTLNYEGTTVIAGLTVNTQTHSADSTITGSNVNLVLTGRDANGGETHATLSEGDMSVLSGATLTLGVEDSPENLYFDGDITVNGDASTLIVNRTVQMGDDQANDRALILTDGADLEVQSTGSIAMKDLTKSADSQVNIAGTLILEEAKTFNTSDFAAQKTDGKIYLTGTLQTNQSLTLNGGGTLDLHTAELQLQNGLNLGAETTIQNATITVNGGNLPNHKLSLEKSSLVINSTSTNGSEIIMDSGDLRINSAGELSTNANVTLTGTTLTIQSGGQFDISGDQLTADIQNFGNVTLSDNNYKFVSFSEDNATVKANLIADGTTKLVLETDNTGDSILLDNYDEMLNALADSIFGDGHSFDIENLTISGYGKYLILSGITADITEVDEVVAAGEYSYNGTSTFAGIVADRDGNADSDITGGGTLNLTGNNGKALSTGNITVTNGRLNLASPTDTGVIEGNLTIQKDGIVTVYNNVSAQGLSMAQNVNLGIAGGATFTSQSEVALQGGSFSVGQGTLEAAGFTNNVIDLTLADGTLKTTNGMTTTKNVTIEIGAGFDLAGGNMDVSDVVFTAKAGASLITAEGTTLTAGIGTIGMNADASTGAPATVVWDASDNVLGNVVIDGLATREFDFTDATDELAFTALSNAAKTAYGNSVQLSFNNISFSGATLTVVGNNGLAGFADTTVAFGSGLSAGTSAIVGAVSGGGGTTPLTVGTGSHLTITGNTAADNDGMLYDGPIEVTDGSVTLGMGSVASVKNTGGTTTLGGGTQITSELELDGVGSALNVQGANNSVGTLKTNSAITYYVGDSTVTIPAGITVQNVNFADNTIGMHDPAWVGGASIAGASYGVYQKFSNDAVNAHLIAGQNSYVVIGNATSAWAQDAFNKSGLTWGESAITSALFVKNPHTLTNTGSLVVDGSLTAVPAVVGNSATFANNSLLVVDANGVGSNTALTAAAGGGTLTVANNARLHIVGGINGQALTVVSGFTTGSLAVGTTSEGWDIDDLVDGKLDGKVEDSLISFDNQLASVASATINDVTGEYTLTLKVTGDDNKYVDGSTSEKYKAAIDKYGSGNTNSANNIEKYLSKLYSAEHNGNATPKQRAEAQIKYDNPAAAVGVSTSGYNASNAASGASVARNSKIGLGSNGSNVSAVNASGGGENSGSEAGGMKAGVGVWLMPMYKWSNIHGTDVSSGLSGDYETGLGGMAVGIDYTNKIDSETALRFGLALNVGAGYTDGLGDMSGISNDFDFWGLSLYGAFEKENFVATLDVGYSSVMSGIDYDGLASVGSSSADVFTSVWTAGLSLEYTFVTEFMNITPHAGVRYTGITTHEYTVDYSGGGLSEVEDDFQGIWSFPVGVTFSKDIATDSGWTFTPKLDVGFIAAAGDLDATSKSKFIGSGNLSSQETFQTVDGFAFNGGLGFELSNEESGVSLGLNYNIQASEHETSHMIFANFRYEF